MGKSALAGAPFVAVCGEQNGGENDVVDDVEAVGEYEYFGFNGTDVWGEQGGDGTGAGGFCGGRGCGGFADPGRVRRDAHKVASIFA